MQITTDLENYHAQHGSYRGAKLNQLAKRIITNNQYYYFQLSDNQDNNYRLSAIPNPQQARQDLRCKALSINAQGKKSIGGDGLIKNCWK